jgi:ABC-type multidrug transport system ATPase subunit
MLSLSVGFAGHLTGQENAILSGMLMGISKKEIVSKLSSIERYSELGDFFYQPVKTYSTGMVARLGFSVAFQVDPDILLIDEVLGVGDALFKKKSSSALKKRMNSNKTVVIVSHNVNTIKRLCDRAILMHRGQIIAKGKPENVINHYHELTKADLSYHIDDEIIATVTPKINSPQFSGQLITLVGNAKGGRGSYEYKFRLKDISTNNPETMQDYSKNNIWSWDTSGYSGQFLISVWVRNAGSKNNWEAYHQIPFQIDAG